MRYRLWCLVLTMTVMPTVTAAESLTVGFADIDVTPKFGDKPVYMAGFGQNRQATSVNDPIMARAIVLAHADRKVAIVTVDVVGLFLPSVERIRKKVTGYDGVLINATHNHEGPDTMGLWGPNAFRSGINRDYLKRLETDVATAITKADAARRPVTARIGTATAPELLNDTRQPIVKHDELVAIRFDDPETGKARGLLVQWNCHPELLGSKNTALSADFVGYTVKELHQRYSCPSVILTGTVGGLMTNLGVDLRDADGKPLKESTFKKTEVYGRAVGKLATRALSKSQPVTLTPLNVRTRKLLLPVDNPFYRLAWQIKVLERPAFEWRDDPYAEPKEFNDPKAKLAIQTEVSYWQFGDMGIAVIPGEIYPELVLGKVVDPAEPEADFPDAPVEPGIYPSMKDKHKMIVGLGNDELGYILPKRQWDEKPPFAYGQDKAPYGEVNSLGPDTGPFICEAFRGLTDDSSKPTPPK